jgi:hypothetical protein
MLGGSFLMGFTIVMSLGSAMVGVLVLDRVIGWAIRCCAPVLPSDVVGPDGWLMDPRNATGIFDRRGML